MAVSFSVEGVPAPKGSKVVWRGRLVEDNKRTMPWVRDIRTAALAAMRGRSPFPVRAPVAVQLVFALRRPASARNRPAPSVRPDGDKLARAVLDALTGVVYADDAQVVSLSVDKMYVNHPYATGVYIRVAEWERPIMDLGPSPIGEPR